MKARLQRVVAALIAGDDILTDQGAKDFARCLDSLYQHFEKIFVAYNGDDFDKVKEWYSHPKVMLRHFTWDDDFAKARQDSFDFAQQYASLSAIQYDWIMWVDSDDTLEIADNYSLQELVNSLDDSTQVVMMRYDYGVDADTEQVLAVQWRERLFRFDLPVKWVYPIHEVAHFPLGTQLARREGVWLRHWREPNSTERGTTRERNRRILSKALKAHPEVPRFKYYFANELYAEALLSHYEEQEGVERTDGESVESLVNAATEKYEEFIPEAPSPDDAYVASHQIGELQRVINNHMAAIEADLRALMIHPSWPDAYIGIAQSYMSLQDWDKCEFWASACLRNCSQQETTQVREPLNDEYIPRLLLGISRENKGDLIGALAQYERIAQFNLTDEVTKKIESVQERIANTQYSDSDLIEDKYKWERKKTFGTQPDKSIAFFTAPLFEPWHPEIVSKGGIGGAETCVMEIAHRFADDGWRVVVFGTPGDYRGEYKGVEYWPSDEWVATEPFTVFVSSRIPDVFDANINAKLKLLWMHDVNSGDRFQGEFGYRYERIDGIIGLTDWHIRHLHGLYGIPLEKFIKIPNGVNLERFENIDESKRQRNKFIWSSSPDRGIDVILSHWPNIKERYEDAELHVFYGWKSIEKILQYEPNAYVGQFYNQVREYVDSLGSNSGIVWHDRVDQQTLANHMKTCHVWAYPTYFMETFCITAIEMQAAGVIPVTSDVAALRETVPNNTLRVTGYPNNKTFNRQFENKIRQVLGYSRFYEERLRLAGYEHAARYSWDNSFQIWRELASLALPLQAA